MSGARVIGALLALPAACLGIGCGSSRSSSSSSPAPAVHLSHSLRLSSAAFVNNGAIPRVFTCEGRDVSLPVHWTGVPSGVRELVLVMRDPDAPGGDFIHWALAGISPSTRGFAAGGVSGQVVPGRNSFGALGYRGPCPPSGKPHHYVLTLSALSAPSGLKPGWTTAQLQVRAVAITTLVGTYGRR
ncbi:MAG: YbhB/YbcL family Raf kinase inhibitor-like protein [Solirubrobacterales bacterium]|nr:YbhB/YbcL family Raf kinase inhibitor-like protein [Solirubrobacterales bacterium]